MKKIGFHIRVDPQLKAIVQHYCKCNNETLTGFISKCIAKELEININDDGSLNADEYINSKVKAIDDCISKLEKEKENLKKSFGGGL